jgi:transposase
MVRKGSIVTEHLLTFLRHLLRHIRGPIILIWDNLQGHKSKKVLQFIHQHRKRIALEFLPAYAPELNPDEGVWRHLKYAELPNFSPDSLLDLTQAIRKASMRMRQRPKLLRSFIKQTGLLL